ncbi:Holliday junction resolvase RecU [Paenibacillus sp. LK1]|uniref:Holliday junction resolvase RecU n=1 Tax=Paenibacillus sp. LK1 TaxID=2053014 RepID=UPI00211DE81E|nr:Holliday junction resolvase RecU [Paenibacillus sp. LK1]
MATNQGKLFEEDFQKSAAQGAEKVFFVRLKDTLIPVDLRSRVRVTKNDYDCMMFAKSHLFTLELKSTKDKSISFQESVIKQHQIDKLNEANAYEGVISGFIMNFREPDNKVYFIHIEEFLKYQNIAQNQIKEHTYRSKVNKSSISIAICEEIGIEIKGFKPRTRWHYHLKDFIEDAINTYGTKLKGVTIEH